MSHVSGTTSRVLATCETRRAASTRTRRVRRPDRIRDTGVAVVEDAVSSDHDPLYRFHQWQANLRILDVEAIKTVPYVPLSHPFVERLIGTIRRECLDRTLFWTAADLELKLLEFQRYFNRHRTHAGLGGLTPEPRTEDDRARASVSKYRWRPHCRGLYQTPIAA